MTQEWQQRVLDEKAALDEKIAKLEVAITRPAFLQLEPDYQEDLRTQLVYMRGYSRVLGYRIARFR